MVNMRHQQLGDTLLMVHSAEAPSEQEWDAMLAQLQKQFPARVLVFTDGGGPTTLQRGRLNDALVGKPVKAAIVTSSQIVRGIVTALAWFNPGIKAFSPVRAPAALDYLGVPVEQRAALMRQVPRLAKELDARGLQCVVWSEDRAQTPGDGE